MSHRVAVFREVQVILMQVHPYTHSCGMQEHPPVQMSVVMMDGADMVGYFLDRTTKRCPHLRLNSSEGATNV